MAIQEKKVALITGANKGIGLEIARQLGQKGIIVVLGSRDQAKGREASEKLKEEGIDASAIKLDVNNANDIASLPGFFEKNFGRLDILINNAGINTDARGDESPDAFRRTYETNVIAPWFITQVLLPLLKASSAGRVVNQSSILGSITTAQTVKELQDAGYPAYNSSKAALNMLTVLQANSLRDTRVKVNAAHPGWVKTEMGGPNAPLETEDGAKTAVELALLPDNGPTGGFFHMGEALPW